MPNDQRRILLPLLVSVYGSLNRWRDRRRAVRVFLDMADGGPFTIQMTSLLTDEQLMAQVVRADSAAFRHLAGRHLTRAYAIAFRLLIFFAASTWLWSRHFPRLAWVWAAESNSLSWRRNFVRHSVTVIVKPM